MGKGQGPMMNCRCRSGFTGDDCSLPGCPDNCNDHGACDTSSGVALCKCAVGYHGEACSKKDCPNQCSGHGVCDMAECTCSEGYTGKDCSMKGCPSNDLSKMCSGHGLCDTMTGKCNCKACKTCAQSWGGAACDV